VYPLPSRLQSCYHAGNICQYQTKAPYERIQGQTAPGHHVPAALVHPCTSLEIISSRNNQRQTTVFSTLIVLLILHHQVLISAVLYQLKFLVKYIISERIVNRPMQSRLDPVQQLDASQISNWPIRKVAISRYKTFQLADWRNPMIRHAG